MVNASQLNEALGYFLALETEPGRYSFMSSKSLDKKAKRLEKSFLSIVSTPDGSEDTWDSITADFEPFLEDKKCLDLNDEPSVVQHYYMLFDLIQQMKCKELARCWIQRIEPRKQTKYPYKHGAASKPDWWPHQIRHKEPDHLLKYERLKLVVHLIRTEFLKTFKVQDPVTKTSKYKLPVFANSSASFKGWLNEIYYLAYKEHQLKQNPSKSKNSLVLVSNLSQKNLRPFRKNSTKSGARRSSSDSSRASELSSSFENTLSDKPIFLATSTPASTSLDEPPDRSQVMSMSSYSSGPMMFSPSETRYWFNPSDNVSC